jgi:hypothetical protein
VVQVDRYKERRLQMVRRTLLVGLTALLLLLAIPHNAKGA